MRYEEFAILNKCGSNKTPQHPHTPFFEKQVSGGQISRARFQKNLFEFFLPPAQAVSMLEYLIFNSFVARLLSSQKKLQPKSGTTIICDKALLGEANISGENIDYRPFVP